MAKRNLRKTFIISIAVIIFLVIGEIVIYQESKVKHLIAVQRVHDLGTKLMNEGKYLEAIDQLSDIDREDTAMYNDSQTKIKLCKEQYIKGKFQMAYTAIQEDKLLQAIKYIDDVSAVDSENIEANLLKAKVNMQFQQEVLPYINKQKRTNIMEDNDEILPKDAVEIVRNLMDSKNSDIQWGYEYTTDKDNATYYIVTSHKSMGDYTAAIGWYCVDVKTAQAFEWDIKNDKLTPIN